MFEGGGVGPFLERGLDEALGLAVGLPYVGHVQSERGDRSRPVDVELGRPPHFMLAPCTSSTSPSARPLRYAGTRTASFDAATAEGSLISLPLRGRRAIEKPPSAPRHVRHAAAAPPSRVMNSRRLLRNSIQKIPVNQSSPFQRSGCAAPMATHSITSSARASSDCETAMPSVFAVLRNRERESDQRRREREVLQGAHVARHALRPARARRRRRRGRAIAVRSRTGRWPRARCRAGAPESAARARRDMIAELA